MWSKRTSILAGFVAVAALLRLVPHPPNFAPIAAMALFSGAQISDRRLALALPIGAMLLADLVLGFHSQLFLVYACLAATVAVGTLLRGRIRPLPVAAATFGGSLLFFVVTNLGVWAFDGLYPHTLDGLVACYVAAVPFFHNSLLGDAFYAGLLFGGFALLERGLPALRPAAG